MASGNDGVAPDAVDLWSQVRRGIYSQIDGVVYAPRSTAFACCAPVSPGKSSRKQVAPRPLQAFSWESSGHFHWFQRVTSRPGAFFLFPCAHPRPAPPSHPTFQTTQAAYVKTIEDDKKNPEFLKSTFLRADARRRPLLQPGSLIPALPPAELAPKDFYRQQSQPASSDRPGQAEPPGSATPATRRPAFCPSNVVSCQRSEAIHASAAALFVVYPQWLAAAGTWIAAFPGNAIPARC